MQLVNALDDEDYRFGVDEYSVEAADVQERTFANYTFLTRMGGLLVAWEVVLASRSRKRAEELPRRITNALNLPRIRPQIIPLERFSNRIGYALVVYRHQAGRPSLAQSDFCRRSGLIVPFKYDYGTFCSNMSDLLSKYGIPISRIRDFDSGTFRVG